MSVQILMPALSPTMTEGTLVRWLKKEGDAVKAGQVLAEIETDKATMEVEAVDEGTLGKILIQAGTQNVKVNTPIAVLLEEGESAAPTASNSVAPPKPVPEAPAPTARVDKPVQASAPVGDATRHGDRVNASPLARRMAEQASLDLMRVAGTGPNGRVVAADVENYLAATKTGKSRAALSSSTLSAPPSLPPLAAQQAVTPSRAAPAPAFAPSPAVGPAPVGIDARDYAEKLGQAYEAHPNSGVRKVIARRLSESKQIVPHFYLSVDCELDALLHLRKGINEHHGAKVSVNDVIIRAVALALRKVPEANAAWTEEAILRYSAVDVSVAVASPNGLVTPIIKNADQKSLLDISAEMKDLAARARDGKLRPEEFQGGGFTISNLGMFGVKSFSAIINPPQSCILAIGAGEERAVVKRGQLAVATVMTCTLSVDHRSVDGAVGAQFLAAFKALIEQPYALAV